MENPPPPLEYPDLFIHQIGTPLKETVCSCCSCILCSYCIVDTVVQSIAFSPFVFDDDIIAYFFLIFFKNIKSTTKSKVWFLFYRWFFWLFCIRNCFSCWKTIQIRFVAFPDWKRWFGTDIRSDKFQTDSIFRRLFL